MKSIDTLDFQKEIDVKLQQPVIRQKQFEYESAPLLQETWGYCYQFTAKEDFVLIPDGDVHFLWDLDEGKLLRFSSENPYIMNGFEYIEEKGHQYFGIALDYANLIKINEEQLQSFSHMLFRFDSFHARCEFCNRQLHHIIYAKSNHPLLICVMDKIIDSGGQIAIESVANRQGYTVRQVERVFADYYGYSPKTMCRIIRMEYVLDMVEKHPEYSFATVAEKLGFSDPPHLLREFKHFAKMTPKEFAVKYFHRAYE